VNPNADEDHAGRAELLAAVGDLIDAQVIAVASGWRSNRVVNLDEAAVRVFIDVLDAKLEAAEPVEEVALVLVGRGGWPRFAEGVWRAVRGRGLRLTVVVPYRVDGVFSLLALAADERILHPYGALGAYDRRPLGQIKARLDAESAALLTRDEAVVESARAEIAFERRHAGLARGLMQRLVGDIDPALFESAIAELGTRRLGSQLAIGAAELDRIGLDSRLADGELAALIWRLYRAYEHALGVREPPTPRYTESQLADEVEFEPAVGVTGALIETSDINRRFELDTGRPDPDTNMLDGRWTQ
jgi:hypothetical protein